ncbi:hypothetical protein OGATHE_003212 [Ogataea polymorpha]|uniref:Uncharacterized protein n=1 Tax=Ogataea polymorpha TaxID=460523 RepID=A0A9P8PA29_9ASCO|nr:hypothetical protein OGATHE_003212 [Ogataea polymorpha]
MVRALSRQNDVQNKRVSSDTLCNSLKKIDPVLWSREFVSSLDSWFRAALLCNAKSVIKIHARETYSRATCGPVGDSSWLLISKNPWISVILLSSHNLSSSHLRRNCSAVSLISAGFRHVSYLTPHIIIALSSNGGVESKWSIISLSTTG